MPYGERTLIDVKEVLRRWAAGQGDRRIGRETGTEVAQHPERIERWLARTGDTRPLRLTKIHTLLVRDHGLRASYHALWRFAAQQLGWHKKTETVRVDDPPPGQEAHRLRRDGSSARHRDGQAAQALGAGARVHGTTRRVPREVFESIEKAAMRPAPDSPFDVPMWIERATVHLDHHIQFAHASMHRLRARAISGPSGNCESSPPRTQHGNCPEMALNLTRHVRCSLSLARPPK